MPNEKNVLLKNALIYSDTDGGFVRADAEVCGGSFRIVGKSRDVGGDLQIIENCILIPGLADVHVHFREPGYFYKESIKSGTMAAAHGGYTAVMTMPNLEPVPDCLENLRVQTDIIDKDAVIGVFPYGALTVGERGAELAKLTELAPYVHGFSDDGKGVQNSELAERAFALAAKLGITVAAHCENEKLLLAHGCVNDCAFAHMHALVGISAESEWKMVERDIEIAAKTRVKYHICHVSTKESVELVRRAKARGIDVTCETAPHYLLLSDGDLKDVGAYKMNPPLRSKDDREALIRGICDGTVDMIATDHAPHSAEEKSLGLKNSKFGIVGLECAFALMYTNFVRNGIITLERLVDLMSGAPARRFGLKNTFPENFTVFECAKPFKIDSAEFLSKGKSTPFDGEEVYGRCLITVCNGGRVWIDHSMLK